ncbi:MAG: hypothetical protein MUO76_17245 [Anaerolineaceae bacterium]|nr:hypothetical protein [Anaerolineaceae bacterium]
MNDQINSRRSIKTLRRVARVWSIVVIAFTLLIAIGEIAFPHTEADVPFLEYLMPVSMFVSVLGLLIAWWREALGGGINIGFFLANIIIYYVVNDRFFPVRGLAILSLAIVPGILFLICWFADGDTRVTS